MKPQSCAAFGGASGRPQVAWSRFVAPRSPSSSEFGAPKQKEANTPKPQSVGNQGAGADVCGP